MYRFKKACRILLNALHHFNDDDGWAMASHVAMSSIIALFPFLIFGTTLASFLGADAFAQTATNLIFETWPDHIAAPIAREVEAVLTIERSGLLTVSAFLAAFFASSGIEALRASLNRAYRIKENRSVIFLRLQSLLFVIIAIFGLSAISLLVVLAPVALSHLNTWFPALSLPLTIVENWRLPVALFILASGLIVSHFWLPNGRRTFKMIIPGILFSMTFWFIGAILFSAYLQSFALYAATYAGLASLMIALIFLYIIAVIFIIGAEINAAIFEENQKHGMQKMAVNTNS